ncbi:hypothetical protein D8L93_09070 [Sodalis-like symbiont of Bactericera trigonica]|nr:hypothetical protein D8L93_09070 [Sodalis-like symbiont of Bactericera trigonica]
MAAVTVIYRGMRSCRRADGWYNRAAVVVAMGLRPCSGAFLVLLFAKVIGVYAWGVLSALMMAVGTALTFLTLGAAGVFWPYRC